jgi:predicted lipoprotein with Yx(FWY)xxD motif
MKRILLLFGASVLGLSGLTACGGGDSNDDSSGGTGSSSSPSAGASRAGAAAKLATADVGAFGKIVVDGNGRTVYVFDKDSDDPPKSNCDGDCAAKWPPVMAGSAAPQLDGIDASLVGTVTRSDGSKQLTIDGYPLYLFGSDSEAGEAKGQAVGGVWWVLGANGEKITTQPSSGGGNDGY